MATPQSGILPESSSDGLIITLDIVPGEDRIERVRALVAAIPRLTARLADAYPESLLSSVVALAPGVWEAITATPKPSQLRTFRARTLGRRKLPSTPTDLLIHIRSGRRDINHELATQIVNRAEGCVTVCEEVAGFCYLDSRDLTGFVDGTENPEGEERAEVALVGEEEPEVAGGSYVMVQRYVHDLTRWNHLAQSQQEQVIGRTKDSDEELDESLKPESAHISRVVIEEEGEELEILRHSLPYGNSGRAGLLFIAYSRELDIFDKMLDRMFDVQGDGIYDHLMDYTQAETGAFFFAPSQELLQRLAD